MQPMSLGTLATASASRPRNRGRRLRTEVLECRDLLASLWQNPLNASDVDGDGHVAPRDALIVINHLNRDGAGPVIPSSDSVFFLDTNGDNQISPHDVLRVINALSSNANERAVEPDTPLDPVAVDALFDLSGLEDSLPLTPPSLDVAAGAMTIGSVLVATCDSSESAKQQADFVGDCDGDQEEINLAIQSIPEIGGVVQLAEGTYDIQAVAGSTGGVTIDKSNIVLQGRGTSTKLLLADNQYVNVIRITGDGTENVTIRDLYINGNWKSNLCSTFECSGVFALTSGAEPLHSITVQQTFVEDSARLNIFLNAVNANIIHNRLGDSGSDSVEILTGPGTISNNYVEIDETTGYVLSTDQASTVTISDNVIWIKPSGSVVQSVIRTWAGRYRHVIADNQVYVQGEINRMLEVNGYLNVITGNLFADYNFLERLSDLEVDGASLIHDNIIMGGRVVLKFSEQWATSVTDNLLFLGSTIEQETATGQRLTHAANNIIAPRT